MDIEQMIGSIKGYLYNQWNVLIITSQIKEEIPVPSIYLPSPSIIPAPDTKMSFANSYSVNVKLFNETSSLAHTKAEQIAQSIKQRKWEIPVLNEDGTKTAETIVFDRIETDIIETGVAQLALGWTHRFDYY